MSAPTLQDEITAFDAGLNSCIKTTEKEEVTRTALYNILKAVIAEVEAMAIGGNQLEGRVSDLDNALAFLEALMDAHKITAERPSQE